MGAGDLTGNGTVRKAIDRKRLVDRTSSMTAGQVERFWVIATRKVLLLLLHEVRTGSSVEFSINKVAIGRSVLEGIAVVSLEELIGK